MSFTWERFLTSIPMRSQLREIRSCFDLVGARYDLWLAYHGLCSLRFVGVLLTEQESIDRAIGLFALHPSVEVGSAVWFLDVRKQMEIAVQAATGGDATRHCSSYIPIGPREGDVPLPRWLFNLACIPLCEDWDGTLSYPRPFCPSLFAIMATQPEAEDWIIRQNLTLAPGVPDRHFGCGRKAQVLHALKSGKSEKEIAYFLNLSTHTVHSFVKSLYRDYGVHSRAELLSRFIIHPRFSPTAD